MNESKDTMAQTGLPSSIDSVVPIRGITRQVSKSRRISRRSTFHLLSVQVTEEEDGSRDSNNGGTDGKKIESTTAHFAAADEVEIPTAAGARISRGIERSTSASSMSSSVSSASFDGPVREIFVTSRDDCDDIQAGDARRRSSDITTESLELLLNQLQQSEQEQNQVQIVRQDRKQRQEQELDQQRHNEKHVPPSQPVQNELQNQTPIERARRRPPRKLLNQLSNLKGSLISISTVVQGNLRKEVLAHQEQQTSSIRRNATHSSSSSSSNATSIDEAETPEELAILASNFHAMDFDGESTMDSSLNSYHIRNGFNDSASFNRASKKTWNRPSFQKVNEAEAMDGHSITSDSIGFYLRRGFQGMSRNANSSNKITKSVGSFDVDGNSVESESLNSYYIRRGMHDSMSSTRVRLSRIANNFKSNMIAENFNVFDMDGDSATSESINSYYIRRGMHDSATLTRARLPRNTKSHANKVTTTLEALDMDGNSTTSESLNSCHVRGGMNDSISLTRAKLSRKCSTGIHDSAGTATTTISTVSSEFRAEGDHLLSFFEASFESLFDNDNDNRPNLERKFAVAGNHQTNDPNDVSSVGSESLDLHDLYMEKCFSQRLKQKRV